MKYRIQFFRSTSYISKTQGLRSYIWLVIIMLNSVALNCSFSLNIALKGMAYFFLLVYSVLHYKKKLKYIGTIVL